MLAVDKKQKILWAIIAVFLLAKIYIAVQPHPVLWDEAVYSGMGKSIYSGGQSGLWEEIRPIGLPLILSAVWKSHLPFAATAEIILALMAAGTIWLAYQTARKLFNDGTAAFSAMLVAGTALFFRQSSLFMTEVPSAFMLMLSLYLAISKKPAMSSLAAGLAAMIKLTNTLMLPVLLLIPALEYLEKKNMKKLLAEIAKATLPLAAIVISFLASNYVAYGSAFEPMKLAFVHQSNPAEATQGLLANILFYVITMLKQNIFFAFIPAGMFMIIKKRSAQKTALLAYAGIFASYFTLIANKQERFALLFIPAAAIIAGYGFYNTLLLNRGTTTQGLLMSGIIILAGVFTAYTVGAANVHYIGERMDAEIPDYAHANGKILSSEPYTAYYTDAKVIPYYFSTADGREGIRMAAARYAQYKNNSAVIYHSRDFYCTEKDTYCREQLSIISAQE